jgi:hypothetical protein
MKNLSKKCRFVCFLLIGFLQPVSTTESATTYLFSRNPKSQKLSYIGIDELREPGEFNRTNTV